MMDRLGKKGDEDLFGVPAPRSYFSALWMGANPRRPFAGFPNSFCCHVAGSQLATQRLLSSCPAAHRVEVWVSLHLDSYGSRIISNSWSTTAPNRKHSSLY